MLFGRGILSLTPLWSHYLTGEPTDDMTDELADAIRYFQADNDGLEVTGELDDDTCARLRGLHECESEAGNSGGQDSAGGDGGEDAPPPGSEEPTE